MIRTTKISEGDYHATFYNVPKNELEAIEKHSNIKNYYLAEELGYSYLKDSKNEYKPYLSLIAANEGYMNKIGIQVKEGRLPQNDSEIIISEHISKNGKVNYAIGDTLTLDICTRTDASGRRLTQNDSFNDEIPETLTKKFTKGYKIVGIMYRPSSATENRSAPGYTIMTKMNEVKEEANIAVSYKNSSTYKEDTESLAGLVKKGDGEAVYPISGLGLYKEKKYDVNMNTQLLTYEGSGLSASNASMIYTLATIIMAIVLVSSVFVIKNGFAISVTERLKQYGMLASVGTTKKQIKKSVYFEGFVLGLIRNTFRDTIWNCCNSNTIKSCKSYSWRISK